MGIKGFQKPDRILLIRKMKQHKPLNERTLSPAGGKNANCIIFPLGILQLVYQITNPAGKKGRQIPWNT